MSEITWILIADGSRARLFEHRRSERSFELVFDDDRPQLRDREAMRGSDRFGRVHESVGQKRHGMQPSTSNDQILRDEFARELAQQLQTGANEQRFGQLMLVAPPTMLGALRSHIGDPLRGLVVAELDKDLTKIPAHELPEHLKDWISVADPPRLENRT
jgi:protein required for attachment to host cells